MARYIVKRGIHVFRYGSKHRARGLATATAPGWIQTTKEVIYSDNDRLVNKNDIINIIQFAIKKLAPNLDASQFRVLDRERINMNDFFWFKTYNTKWPIFAVHKNDVVKG